MNKIAVITVALFFAQSMLISTLAAAAKAKKPETRKASGSQKYIRTESSASSQSKARIDFDAADISGARKSPMGSIINQTKADKEYDFIKIRLRWHPEMIQSASEVGSRK